MYDWIGWLATLVFASSYFCKDPMTLRIVQAVAAVVWVGYGVLIGAMPVVGANVVVAALAAFSAWRTRERHDNGEKQVAGSPTIISGTGAKGSGFPLQLRQPAKPAPHFEAE